MEREISCPSGLRGIIRSLKVKDEQLFTDPKLRRDGRLVVAVVQRCWNSTVHPGPYALDDRGGLPWDKILQADAFYAFMQIRVLSYGKDYEFKYQCESCKRVSKHLVDLDTLTLRLLSSAGKRHAETGEPLGAEVGGRQIAYRLLQVEDWKAIEMLQESRKLSLRAAAVVARLQEVQGVDKHPSNIIRYVEELEGSEFEDLERALEAEEAGIETLVDLDCRHCYGTDHVALPLGPTFFSKPVSTPSSRSETGSSA